MKKELSVSFPNSWNACTLEQLRIIASLLRDEAARVTRFHQFDMFAVKVAAFFALSNLEIVRMPNNKEPKAQRTYVVRLQPKTIFGRVKRWALNCVVGGVDEYTLPASQIAQWIKPIPNPKEKGKQRGLFDWLDCEGNNLLLTFPFAKVRRRRFLKSEVFSGPAPLLDGFTWQRYRLAQDYMESVVRRQNDLLRLQAQGRKAKAEDIENALYNLSLTRAFFLGTIFERKITHTDPVTGQRTRAYDYYVAQPLDLQPWFMTFPDDDFQIVLLWWSGVMKWLQGRYSRVFKPQKLSGSAKAANPLEVYTRTTATIEKYVGITAADADREPYTTVLQHIEDIMRSNEELEKINRKSK